MTELVPIKVKICLGADGHHKFPAFNNLPQGVRNGLDWSSYFDKHGIGWFYDSLSGFGETDSDGEHSNNDPSCWFGATCVPSAFADAAASAFAEVTIISEASFRTFYDDRASVFAETEILDVEVLQGLLLRIQLEADPNAPTVTPSAEILALRAQMLDPESPRRGIRKNPKRKWADFKALAGVTIRAGEAE